jgi:iron-sulfur cluster repair protein YtfE (RIC family)
MGSRLSRGGFLSRRTLAAVLGAVAVAATAGAAVTVRRMRARAAEQEAPDVGFMLAMHNAFRRNLAGLAGLAKDADTTPSADERFEREWNAFRERLHRHHAAEDDDLWPILRARLTSPADLASVDQMVEEHHALALAIDELDGALSARHGTGTETDASSALDRLSRTLRDHLDHEERDVLPLVESHLSRAEWRSFLVTERRQTPPPARPAFLGWVLDQAGPDDTRAVLAELPPPGRLAYRWLIGPRYRKQREAA